MLTSAWKAYSGQAGDAPSGDGFRAWLDQNKDAQAEALAYVNSLRDMCINVISIGLNPAEQTASLKKVTDPLNGVMPKENLEQTLGVTLS